MICGTDAFQLVRRRKCGTMLPQMKRTKNRGGIRLLVADAAGAVYEHPRLMAAIWDGARMAPAGGDDFSPLRDGGRLVSLPGRRAVGFDPATGRMEVADHIVVDGRSVDCTAVAAIVPPGDARLLLPAYETGRNAPALPLFAYCAAGWMDGKFAAASVRVDSHRHWDCRHFNTPDLDRRIASMLRKFPRNGILKQLALCSREYSCCTAQNIFYRRWEGGIPVSPACNARCLGCISKQEGGCNPPPAQFRIDREPRPDEIAELAVEHLAHAERPTISFGQGCEGEPTLSGDIIREAIRLIRAKTARGLIHMNTNGSRPAVLSRLADAGLQSVRIAVNSAVPEIHGAYFRPAGFDFPDVEASMSLAVHRGLKVSVNLLVMPGLSDRPEEIRALIALLKRTGVHCLQLRNLCMDPESYFKAVGPVKIRLPGMKAMLAQVHKALPTLEIGCFNPLPEKRR